MTGKYPVKTGVTDWIAGRQANNKTWPYEKLLARPTAYQLALKEETIAEIAVKSGYKTFYAGKWHLGENEKYWPELQGWEINKGGWSKGHPDGFKNDSTGGHFTPYNNPRLPDGPPGEYLTDRLAEIHSIPGKEFHFSFPDDVFDVYAAHPTAGSQRALIEKYKAKQKQLGLSDEQRFRKDEPWMKFETVWKQRLVQDHPVYAAMIESMDVNVGRILSSLELLGIDKNTIVIFTIGQWWDQHCGWKPYL